MNRLQKKCLIASMGAHILLGVILLLGAAFASRHKEDEEAPPMMTLIPARLIDAQGFGGGDPNVTKAPAPAKIAPVVAPPVEAAPLKTELKADSKPPEATPPAEPKPETKVEATPPEPAKPARRPKTKAPEPNYDELLANLKDLDQTPPKDNPNKLPKKIKEPKQTKKADLAPETKKRGIIVNLTPVKTAGPSPAEAARSARHHAEAVEKQRAALEAYRAALEQRSAALGNVLNRLDKGLSTGTAITMPGPGGEAFANYGLYVRGVYDSAWSAPADAPDNSAKVEIKVIIARDGQVVSSEITRKSGNATLDKSVLRALNAVRKFPPFPAESSDRERIFIINFDLKAKRQIG